MTVTLPMCSVNFMDTTLSVEEQAIADRIQELKEQLGDDLLILGHHYQRDSIVMHADFLGDSFMLSQKAAESDAKYIVFCGVHFMAESADILTSDDQSVVLPNLRAGCSMADMATLAEVEVAWQELLDQSGLSDPISREHPEDVAGEEKPSSCPSPMNSSADLKDFVGRPGGVVCTSSNAEGVLNWAFERAGPKGAVLFFPDQHLGRNTGLAMGISEDRMPTWTPGFGAMGSLNDARIVLWHGFCSVHKRFTPQQIAEFREQHPDGIVVVSRMPEGDGRTRRRLRLNPIHSQFRERAARRGLHRHWDGDQHGRQVGPRTPRQAHRVLGRGNLPLLDHVYDSPCVPDGRVGTPGRR